MTLNSLTPGSCGCNFESVLSKQFTSTSYETAVRWMSQKTFNDKSALVQVMAWCRQAANVDPDLWHHMVSLGTLPGTHFTNDFSITIQIRWKFHLALIQLLVIISRQNLAHATTAQLSCHVPNIVAITILLFGWEKNEISISFELWWKNC